MTQGAVMETINAQQMEAIVSTVLVARESLVQHGVPMGDSLIMTGCALGVMLSGGGNG